jgi:hypothetical protein
MALSVVAGVDDGAASGSFFFLELSREEAVGRRRLGFEPMGVEEDALGLFSWCTGQLNEMMFGGVRE